MDLTKLVVTNVTLRIYLGAFQKAWKPTLVGSRAPTDLVLLQPPNRERENHVGTSWILPFLDRTGRKWCAQTKGRDDSLTSGNRIQKFGHSKGNEKDAAAIGRLKWCSWPLIFHAKQQAGTSIKWARIPGQVQPLSRRLPNDGDREKARREWKTKNEFEKIKREKEMSFHHEWNVMRVYLVMRRKYRYSRKRSKISSWSLSSISAKTFVGDGSYFFTR